MRTIKIFTLPSHQTKDRTSGVDLARVIQPSKALNGYTDGQVKFEVTLFDIEKESNWLEVSKTYDIIFLNYINNPWGFAAMGAMARKNGVKLVMDIDDAIWQLKSDNPAHGVYKKGSEALHNFTAICNEVDYLTTTNDYLKHVIMNNTTKRADQIKVFPNYIDLKLYSHRSPFKNDGQIKLLHYGSSTHANDLDGHEFFMGVDKIMREYPNVNILTVSGTFIPKLKNKWGARYESGFGIPDIYKWIKEGFPEYMDQADILVVPLTPDIYNKCKSNIKYLEASSAKIPGVYQRLRQYEESIDEGSNGMLASTDKEWYKALKALIDQPELRRRMGQNAYNTVVENHQLKDHVAEYADFFKFILT